MLISAGHVIVGQQSFTTTVNVVLVAHCPASGVNVYITDPDEPVLMVAGLQLPTYPLFEVDGNKAGESPMQ